MCSERVSARYLGNLGKIVKKAKNGQGGSWGLVHCTWHGVTWTGFGSVSKNKSKPEEREEERSAFETLFSHSQGVSLSTYSLGHIVLNTISLIITVRGLQKAGRWEPDKPVVKADIDRCLDGPCHPVQPWHGAGDPSPAALWDTELPWGCTGVTSGSSASAGVLQIPI